jgi:hypothetical protein
MLLMSDKVLPVLPGALAGSWNVPGIIALEPFASRLKISPVEGIPLPNDGGSALSRSPAIATNGNVNAENRGRILHTVRMSIFIPPWVGYHTEY